MSFWDVVSRTPEERELEWYRDKLKGLEEDIAQVRARIGQLEEQVKKQGRAA